MAVLTPPVVTPVDESREEQNVGNARGLCQWQGQNISATRWGISYRRFTWAQLENTTLKGRYEYTWQPLDSLIRDAQSTEGGKPKARVIVRVRLMANGRARVLPPFLAAKHVRHDDGLWYPLWNDGELQAEFARFQEAMAARYDDAAMYAVEIGALGRFGEGHSYGPAWNLPTDATIRWSVDAVCAAWTRPWVLVPLDTPRQALYALDKSPAIGWYRTALGHWPSFAISEAGYYHFRDGLTRRYRDTVPRSEWDLVRTRFRTAPINAEFYNLMRRKPPGYPDFARARDDVLELGVSLVGDGNVLPFAEMPRQQQAQYRALGAAAGHRYTINSVTIPDAWVAGAAVPIAIELQNRGAAPVYDDARLVCRLRRDGETLAVCGLHYDLRTLYGGASDTIAATWLLPSQLPAGGYDLVLGTELPPATARAAEPLRLSHDRQPDGGYFLGRVTVDGA